MKETKELEESARRLGTAGLSVAVWPDGRMRIVAGSVSAIYAWQDGAMVFTPQEMLDYVTKLDEPARRLVRELKSLKPGPVPRGTGRNDDDSPNG